MRGARLRRLNHDDLGRRLARLHETPLADEPIVRCAYLLLLLSGRGAGVARRAIAAVGRHLPVEGRTCRFHPVRSISCCVLPLQVKDSTLIRHCRSGDVQSGGRRESLCPPPPSPSADGPLLSLSCDFVCIAVCARRVDRRRSWPAGRRRLGQTVHIRRIIVIPPGRQCDRRRGDRQRGRRLGPPLPA